MSKQGWVFVQDSIPELIRPAELSFFSLTERLAQISEQRYPLERLNAVIDWQIFQPVLDRVFPAVAPKGHGGRPTYSRLFLCKILVLQRLYELSDEATQYQIKPTLLGTTRFVPSGRSLPSIFSKFQTSRFKKLGFRKSPEGKLVELAEYCCYDVKITKLLHEYGCKNREVFYKTDSDRC